jgi:hypothetical protein
LPATETTEAPSPPAPPCEFEHRADADDVGDAAGDGGQRLLDGVRDVVGGAGAREIDERRARHDVHRFAHRAKRELEVGGLLGAELHLNFVLLLILEPAHGRGDHVRADADVQDRVAAVTAGHGLVARAGVGVQGRHRGAGKDAALRIGHGARDVAGGHGLRARGRHAEQHKTQRDREAPGGLGTQFHQ